MKRQIFSLAALIVSCAPLWHKAEKPAFKSYVRVLWLTKDENDQLAPVTQTLASTAVVDLGDQISSREYDPMVTNKYAENVAKWVELAKKRYTQADKIIVKVSYIALSMQTTYRVEYDTRTGKTRSGFFG